MTYRAVTSLVAGLALAGAGYPLRAAEAGDWQFTVAPLYLWAKNVEGNSSAGGRESPLTLDFKDDILENLDTSLTVRGEASNGAWTFFLEYNYARLKPTTETFVGPVPFTTDVDFEDTLTEGGVTWTFADNDSGRWELLGGLRYFKQDIELDISNALPIEGPLTRKIDVGDSWMHPIIGLRYTTALSQRWSFRARTDYGYEGSDNSSLNAAAFFNYRFRDWGSVFIGYRYIEIDFDNGTSRIEQYGFDGDQQGPMAGLNLHF